MTKVPFHIRTNSRTLVSFHLGMKLAGKSIHAKIKTLLLICSKSNSEVWRRKRCPAAGAAAWRCCTWRRSRRWRSRWPPFCLGTMGAWEPGRVGRDTTRYSSSVTPSMVAPATCSSLPSLVTSWSSNSKTDIANGTPVTPPISSTLPSTNSSPRSLSLSLFLYKHMCVVRIMAKWLNSSFPIRLD